MSQPYPDTQLRLSSGTTTLHRKMVVAQSVCNHYILDADGTEPINSILTALALPHVPLYNVATTNAVAPTDTVQALAGATLHGNYGTLDFEVIVA